MNYPRKNLIYLKQVYTFQSNQIKFENLRNFTTIEKIHRSFINNLKSEETKSQIKAHLSYLANSYFYNYKPSARILRQHRVLRKLRNNKDIVITQPDKGNGVVILDRKLYHNAIQEMVSDTSKFEYLNEDPTVKREASLQRFFRKLKQKTFLTKMNMINCILLVLLSLVSMVVLKCTNSHLVIHFLNFVRLFHL